MIPAAFFFQCLALHFEGTLSGTDSRSVFFSA